MQNPGLLLLISSVGAYRTALTSEVYFENLLKEFIVAITACGIETATSSFQQDCPRHRAAGAVLPCLNWTLRKEKLPCWTFVALVISASSHSKLFLCESISKTKWLLFILAQITLYGMPYKKKYPQLHTPYSGISEFGFDILLHKAEGKIEHIYCKV